MSDERMAETNDGPGAPGGRSSVARVLERIAQSATLEKVVADCSDLTFGEVEAALEYAATLVSQSLDGNRDSQASRKIDLGKVLVVDDQEDNLFLIDRILSHRGFTVGLASSGEEALEKARAERPFLILTDIMMPEMDGFELCQKLKADERTRDAAVILITAGSYDSARVSRGLEMGADEYLSRPIRNRELVARVRAVARLKRAEVEARRRARVVARRNRELGFLNDLALAASSFSDLQEVLVSSMPSLLQLLDAEVVALFLLEERQALRVSLVSSSGEPFSDSFDFRPRSDVTPQLLREQIPAVLSTVFDSPEIGSKNESAVDLSAIHSVPMTSRDDVIGAIVVVPRREASLKDADRMLLNSVAGVATMAVENSRLFAEVQEFNFHLERMVEQRTRQLVEEERKTAAILASMADGLLVLDADGCVLAANKVAEKMLGFRLEGLEGQRVAGELLDSPLWRCVSDMAASDELKLSAAVDLSRSSRSDDVLSIEARSAKMWDEDGQPAGTVIVLRDITALKEIERMKARFMAGVTHELKTPLSVIRVHADNLSNYYNRLSKRKKKEMLKTVRKQVALLEQWVEDILDLTRLGASAIDMERRKVDVGMLTDEVLVDLRPLAEAKRIDLRWERPAASFVAVGDRKLVARVVRNLVDNAIKYTPDEGVVEVRVLSEADAEQRYVSIQVSDTGVGIAPVHQDRIFERFYRVDPSRTVPGTGLGLAIVREIVEAHGGEMRLESTPGEGSTFTVMLPGG